MEDLLEQRIREREAILLISLQVPPDLIKIIVNFAYPPDIPTSVIHTLKSPGEYRQCQTHNTIKACHPTRTEINVYLPSSKDFCCATLAVQLVADKILLVSLALNFPKSTHLTLSQTFHTTIKRLVAFLDGADNTSFYYAIGNATDRAIFRDASRYYFISRST